MLEINKSNNSVVFTGTDNKYFPDNGKISVPLNSLIMVLDSSDMVTFRSSANNNVYCSGRISQIRIAGATVTKESIVAQFDAVSNSSQGGGGGGGDYDDTEIRQMIANESAARAQGDNNLQLQLDSVNDDAVKASVSGTTLILDKLS